jgi:hypothetical protein
VAASRIQIDDILRRLDAALAILVGAAIEEEGEER